MFFRKNVISCLGAGLALSASAVAWPRLDPAMQPLYDSIFEPRVVATPPGDAPCGPVATASGDLLCYGSQLIGGKRLAVTLVSHDLGLNWTLRPRQDSDRVLTPCPWDPSYSINVGHTPNATNREAGMCWIERIGPNGRKTMTRVPLTGLTTYGKVRALPSRHRWVFVFFKQFTDKIGYYPCLVYSDDDGRTWSPRIEVTNTVNVAEVRAPDKSHRWDTGCNEPDLVELKDGTLLMVARTGTDHHVWYTSRDGGLTWSAPFERPAFWASNTQPLLNRLSDGRILFLWNNTQILPRFDLSDYPELGRDEIRGRWEAVFTNRDALHAAISEDEGKTWIGFREIALNAVRNREDYRESGNEFWQMQGGSGIDKSVHQTQVLELPGGKVAVTYGQAVSSRRVAIFDLKWLYEKGREEDLRRGTENLSNHLYLKSLLGGYRGWSGHAAMNRVAGAAMVREPDTNAKTRREALQICRIRDERLVDDHQGVAWNFPAAKAGEVSFECRVEGAGVLASLCDHWVNPSDSAIRERARASFPVEAATLGGAGKWAVVTLAWDLDKGEATLTCGARVVRSDLKREGFAPEGVSYLHLQTLATEHDPKGVYFRWFKMKAK